MKQKGNALCPWDPLTLRFRDERLEVDFWTGRTRHLLRRLDVAWTVHSIVALMLVELQLLKLAKTSFCFVAGSLAQALLYVAILVGAYWQPDWYARCRTLLICCCRWNGMFLFSNAFSALGSVEEGMWEFLGRTLFRTTMGGLAIIPLIVQLQFCAHTAAAVIGLFISLAITSPTYCQELVVSSALQSNVQALGKGIENWIERAAFLGGGLKINTRTKTAEQPLSCWVVVAFTDMAFGVMLSGALLYLLECYCRVQFLKVQDVGEIRKNSYARLWQKSLLMVLWITVVSTMSAWCLLRAWDDAARVAGEHLQGFHCDRAADAP